MLPWPGATIILLQYSKLKLTLAFFFIADKINTHWFAMKPIFGNDLSGSRNLEKNDLLNDWFDGFYPRPRPKKQQIRGIGTSRERMFRLWTRCITSFIGSRGVCTICLLGFAYLLVHFPFRWALSCSSSTSHISVDPPTSSACAAGKMCNEGSGISGRYWLCQMRNPQ